MFVPAQTPVDSAPSGALGNWRLVRTPGPEKSDIVSIMHTADALRSDPEFAGMMIRCRPKSALQVAFVLVTPLPPRTHPVVAVTAGAASARFQGEVIPPGSMIALPDEAEVLVKGPWRSASQLTVEIQGAESKIHGIVSLEHLSGAVSSLQASCPAP